MYLFTSGTRAEGHVNVLWVREEDGVRGASAFLFLKLLQRPGSHPPSLWLISETKLSDLRAHSPYYPEPLGPLLRWFRA